MWYGETGLFYPTAVYPENGYRCGSYCRSSILETILLLWELNASVGEIQAFMNYRSAAPVWKRFCGKSWRERAIKSRGTERLSSSAFYAL